MCASGGMGPAQASLGLGLWAGQERRCSGRERCTSTSDRARAKSELWRSNFFEPSPPSIESVPWREEQPRSEDEIEQAATRRGARMEARWGHVRLGKMERGAWARRGGDE